MSSSSIWDNIRELVGRVAWLVFLWSIKMTKERYWESIAKSLEDK